MSSNTNETWLYQIAGRDIHLYQYGYSANTDTIAGIRIRLPQPYFGNQVIYPDEDITSGLRIEGTALISPFVSEALETTTAVTGSSTISFNDDGDSASGYNDMYDSPGDGFGDFASGDRIRIIGSASNDGDYTLTSVSGSPRYIQVATGNFTDEIAGESVSVYQIPKEDSSPSETSHVNLNRMLCLAVVDYVKAQVAEISGSVELKEYYIKEFWKKIGDDQSNKLKHSISFASNVYSVV